LDEGPAELVIANRHPGKAVLLAQLFAETGNVRGLSLASVQGPFDLVVNATSASLNGEIPEVSAEIFAGAGAAYDMFYADRPTVFLEWAREAGAGRMADGWGMMVEQAAEAFFVWRGVRPETADLLSADRQQRGTLRG